jgi:hypothetical protein
MVIKCTEVHVLPNLESTTNASTYFNLWISKGDLDTFYLVIDHLNETWNFITFND